MQKQKFDPAEIAKSFLTVVVCADAAVDALKRLVVNLKQIQYRLLTKKYCTLSGAERNSQVGRDMVAKMHRLRLEIMELQYRPVWLLVVYYNGHRIGEQILPTLDGITFGEKTIDSDTLKVTCSGAINDRFVCMYELLSFDEYRLFKTGKKITAKKI